MPNTVCMYLIDRSIPSHAFGSPIPTGWYVVFSSKTQCQTVHYAQCMGYTYAGNQGFTPYFPSYNKVCFM